MGRDTVAEAEQLVPLMNALRVAAVVVHGAVRVPVTVFTPVPKTPELVRVTVPTLEVTLRVPAALLTTFIVKFQVHWLPPGCPAQLTFASEIIMHWEPQEPAGGTGTVAVVVQVKPHPANVKVKAAVGPEAVKTNDITLPEVTGLIVLGLTKLAPVPLVMVRAWLAHPRLSVITAVAV